MRSKYHLFTNKAFFKIFSHLFDQKLHEEIAKNEVPEPVQKEKAPKYGECKTGSIENWNREDVL